MSLVDGYTLPYMLQVTTPDGSSCNGGQGAVPSTVNCRNLDLRKCPTTENLSQGLSIITPSYNSVNLGVTNPSATSSIAGCFSPCSKFSFLQWNPMGSLSPSNSEAILYCCPGPITSEQCSAGPVANSDYVQLIHAMCPGVYAYAYDDGNGLFTCKAGTHFTVTFFDPVGATAAISSDDASSGTDKTPLYIILPITISVTIVIIVVVFLVYRWKKNNPSEIV